MDYLPLALIAMFFIGIHYFLVKLISPQVSGPAVGLWSCVLIIPVMLAYIYLTGTPIVPEQPVYLGYAFLIVLLLATGVLTLYMAIQRGPVLVVMPVYGLNTMITALLSIFLLQETISVEKVLGLILAVAAIVLLRR
ncbi:MAG: DMT family transporter [Dehalococcoidales bacterium]